MRGRAHAGNGDTRSIISALGGGRLNRIEVSDIIIMSLYIAMLADAVLAASNSGCPVQESFYFSANDTDYEIDLWQTGSQFTTFINNLINGSCGVMELSANLSKSLQSANFDSFWTAGGCDVALSRFAGQEAQNATEQCLIALAAAADQSWNNAITNSDNLTFALGFSIPFGIVLLACIAVGVYHCIKARISSCSENTDVELHPIPAVQIAQEQERQVQQNHPESIDSPAKAEPEEDKSETDNKSDGELRPTW